MDGNSVFILIIEDDSIEDIDTISVFSTFEKAVSAARDHADRHGGFARDMGLGKPVEDGGIVYWANYRHIEYRDLCYTRVYKRKLR